jgi:diketogulonate reductase-like aldo/keto reductase
VEASVSTFLQLGGRRIDSSASYHNQLYSAIAARASGVPRAELFFTSKVGPFLPLGYAESWAQLNTTLAVTGLGYVDLLLIHWPDCSGGSSCATPTSEPACAFGARGYNATACRLRTWAALVDIFDAGLARAIGVSNYNATHLQEIADAGLPLPAVNQIPFFSYKSSAQAGTIAWCAARGVVVNGYSPFGVPDRRTYAPPMSVTPLVDPVVGAVAAAHATTPANVILAWHFQQGVVFNPRSQNAAHFVENLGLGALPWWAVSLSASEMAALSSRPQDGCDVDAHWYECAPVAGATAPAPPRM